MHPSVTPADIEAAKEAMLLRNLFGAERSYEESVECLAQAFAARAAAAVEGERERLLPLLRDCLNEISITQDGVEVIDEPEAWGELEGLKDQLKLEIEGVAAPPADEPLTEAEQAYAAGGRDMEALHVRTLKQLREKYVKQDKNCEACAIDTAIEFIKSVEVKSDEPLTEGKVKEMLPATFSNSAGESALYVGDIGTLAWSDVCGVFRILLNSKDVALASIGTTQRFAALVEAMGIRPEVGA
jgi:hypothetical protein